MLLNSKKHKNGCHCLKDSEILQNGEEVNFKFEIADIYKGDLYDDTAITGITIEFSRPAGH